MTSSGSVTTPESPGTPRRHRLRNTALACVAVVALLAAGFVWFVRNLPMQETAPAASADGIVVLTGAAFRINDALDLLASGRGRRLLITGVYPTTRSVEISRLMPEHKRWFDCCVDLDHSALNTIGNAVEAAYRRGDLFEKRRHLMNDWAAFCERRAASDVVPLRRVPR